ncbi:uncharacterized protein LOC123477131 [Daphnia magna]|uniref:uncharacterized protein LOC123477131 n=1 Tax=Daphnia magna TaxID=35525 RepID=UPI001E1BBA2D|nr:uncharacterized protein LOC123477131 [Daphnia magna]
MRVFNVRELVHFLLVMFDLKLCQCVTSSMNFENELLVLQDGRKVLPVIFIFEKRLPFCNRTKIGMTTTPCVNSTKSRRNVTGEPFNHFVFACSYDDAIIKGVLGGEHEDSPFQHLWIFHSNGIVLAGVRINCTLN